MLIAAVGAGDPVGKLEIAFARLAQQQQPMRHITLRVVSEPRIATNDRLYPTAARRHVEFDHPKNVAEVGERERRHDVCSGRSNCVVDANHAVDDRILAMQSQMDETDGSGTVHGVEFYAF